MRVFRFQEVGGNWRNLVEDGHNMGTILYSLSPYRSIANRLIVFSTKYSFPSTHAVALTLNSDTNVAAISSFSCSGIAHLVQYSNVIGFYSWSRGRKAPLPFSLNRNWRRPGVVERTSAGELVLQCLRDGPRLCNLCSDILLSA
jgi:hypothetical protein